MDAGPYGIESTLKEAEKFGAQTIGAGMNIEEARKPLFTTGGSERSGMGFTIMESFMTDFTVISKPGKGTTVHMRRKLQRRK